MAVNHRVLRLVVAFTFGLLISYCSYQWATDSDRPQRRAEEENVVLASREILRSYIGADDLALSDPLNRVREAGKVYIYPVDSGWEISGHYQRPGENTWHDFLLNLDDESGLVNLKVRDDDPRLVELAATDPMFSTDN